MNDSASVAISETRPKRSGGGCVGIFFQLFDWNRRFANKKLFSKRLLPPGRGKDVSNKFGCDEKLPKLKLIANENTPNGASSSLGKNEAQTPTLVARLMGLESMPSVKRDKLLKQKVVSEETTLQEFRPQKLQNTGMFNTTRTVTRFGAEALQLKNVLYRSRKHHHQKLASPVKTARRSTSRLIGAATRILEPGLQARKSKYAITYYAHTKRSPNELRSEYMKNGNLDFSRKQASCKNCGNLVDIPESTQSSKRDYVNPSHLSPNGNSRYAIDTLPIDHGRQPQSFAFSPYFNDNNNRIPVIDVGVSSQSKSNCLPFNKGTSATDAVSDTKDFVALNRMSLNGRTRSRVPPKVEDTNFDNCLSSGKKRQLMHIRKQGESSSNNMPRMVSSTSTGKRMGSEPSSRFAGCSNNNSDGMAFRFNSPTKNRREVPTKVERRRNQNVSPCKTTSCNKFTLNHQSDAFPLTGDSLGVLIEKKMHELTSQVEDESRINDSQPKRTPANKFQELICALNMERSLPQKDMEFSPQNNHLPHHRSMYDHKKSFCLKVLIAGGSDRRGCRIAGGRRDRRLGAGPFFLRRWEHLVQPRSEKAGESTGGRNSDHLSPGSVLEASFSNDSCCSSSLEDSSVRTQHVYSISHSYDESQFQDSETVPFYSGVLLSEENTHNELVAGFLSYISKVLYSIDIVNSRIKGNIRAHVKEVIFYSELVLGNQILHNSRPNEINYFFVCDLLLELETLVEIMWTRFGNIFGSQNLNAGYQLKLFVFDALIEYLDSKYVQYSKCGFRVWMNLCPFMGSGIFIHEFVKEVRGWIGYVGVTSDDELVERDMSHSLGKWTDFEIEGYETGAKIAEYILQMLVHEIVVHLSTGPMI